MYLEVTGLSQQQQTEGVIELGVGEQHGLQRRVPDPAWVQGREGLDLSANVGGSVEQEPSPVVGAHRDRRLGARTAGPRAVAQGPTLRATAVPLRKPSSRCRSEHTHPHTLPQSFSLAGNAPRQDGDSAGAGPLNGPAPYPPIPREKRTQSPQHWSRSPRTRGSPNP